MSLNQDYDILPDVNPSEELWRRVYWNRGFEQIVSDEKGGFRPSSAVFKDRFNRLSVDIASKSTSENTISVHGEGPRGDGLIGFLASIPQSHGHPVKEDPQPNNPAHAVILGEMKTPTIREIIRRFRWIISPR